MASKKSVVFRCVDYHGVQFCRRLIAVKTPFVQKAMIAEYKGRVDEAEELYLSHDRPELAIQLRRKIGDVLRAEDLVKTHGCDDYAKTQLQHLIGDHYNEQRNWNTAANYYTQVRQQNPRFLN